jgi:hypothetical protein
MDYDVMSHCGKWMYGNRLQCGQNVMSFPAPYFYKLGFCFLSVPLISGGNNLENESV